MPDKRAIAEILSRASDAHGAVFHYVDGDDPDWSSFYSDFLVNHSPLSDALGKTPIRGHLTAALIELDREYTESGSSMSWEEYYAEGLVGRFG